MSQHNGAIVEKVIRREGHSLTDIAKIIGVNRRSIYNWFLQPRLKPEIIVKIGRTIKHDFSVEFPNQFVSDDFKPETENLSTDLNSSGEMNVWKEKYIDLLERYNFLLTSKRVKQTVDLDSTFNILFVNEKSDEYKIDLKNPPSALFLDKCKKAGYKIKGINRAEVARERTHKFTDRSIEEKKYSRPDHL